MVDHLYYVCIISLGILFIKKGRENFQINKQLLPNKSGLMIECPFG